MKQKGKRSIYICIAALAMMLVWTITAFADSSSGPIYNRQPVQYEYDLSNAENPIKNLTTGATYGDLNSMPFMFPGDSMDIIPESIVKNDWSDVGLEYNVNGVETPPNPPIRVDMRGTYAINLEGDEEGACTPIQKFTIVGDYAVRMSSAGSATVGYKYYPDSSWEGYNVLYLSFSAYTKTQKIVYEYNVDENDLIFYDSNQNASLIWSSDAIYNSELIAKNSDTSSLVTYTLNYPHAEGYYLSRVSVPSDDSTSELNCWLNLTGVSQTPWRQEQASMYPTFQYMQPSYRTNSVRGSDTDAITVKFEFSKDKTLTLDACGGTIEGLGKKIYIFSELSNEIYNRTNDFNEGFRKYIPVRSGYIFDGWFADPSYNTEVTDVEAELTKYTDSGSTVNERACRLYAKWTSEKEISDREAAANVTATLTSFDTSDASAVEAARAAYDALTEDQKKLVAADVYKRLTDAEEAMRPTEPAPSEPDTGSETPMTILPAPQTEDLSIGTIVEVKGAQYKVTEAYNAVQYMKPLNNKIKSATVPATISVSGAKLNVTSIAPKAFSGCKKLKKVTIGKNVKKIGAKAFYKCSKLSLVTFKGKTVKTGSKAFKGTAKSLKVKGPKKGLKGLKKQVKKAGGKVK